MTLGQRAILIGVALLVVVTMCVGKQLADAWEQACYRETYCATNYWKEQGLVVRSAVVRPLLDANEKVRDTANSQGISRKLWRVGPQA